MGSVRSRYPSTPDAPAVLELSTELGAVKVHGGKGDSKTDEQLSPLFRPANERPLEWLN